ncbi:MAG: dephospho-CoA kinase [Legionellales bacterium RIFCSPHIGHO2_12_FULL_42_9]|nr:MAG: dephospho-CoA kinase [Legionellales bacterium RIFCSPHIGHO2_12_FULL_42_9]
MMYCVGLTGTIASGKTTVLGYFSDLGISTISADAIARQITNFEPAVLQAIRNYFGDGVFLPTGELNRRALRSIVFSNPKKRLWLENLLHPLIKQQIQAEIRTVKTPYCVIEIPLLFNREEFLYINRVLLITADKATILTRIMTRDKCSKDDAMAILKSQPDEESRKQIADDIIFNNQDPEVLRESINTLDEQYRISATSVC